MTRRFDELAGSDVATVLTPASVLVVPIGAIEHHGPHLPLVTDALVAEAVATAAVDSAVAAGLDAWLLPTLSVTKSDEHHWAPGTLWLRAETLLDTLVDLGRSVAATPARKLVFVNGHGGNVDGRPDEKGLGIHAGYAETSVLLHLRPDLVHPDRFARNVPEHFGEYEHIGFNGYPVSFGWLSDDFGPTGVIGDPTGATAEAGAAMFSESVAFVASALAEIGRFRHGGRE
jgi:creatinine amidohydrolase